MAQHLLLHAHLVAHHHGPSDHRHAPHGPSGDDRHENLQHCWVGLGENLPMVRDVLKCQLHLWLDLACDRHDLFQVGGHAGHSCLLIQLNNFLFISNLDIKSQIAFKKVSIGILLALIYYSLYYHLNMSRRAQLYHSDFREWPRSGRPPRMRSGLRSPGSLIETQNLNLREEFGSKTAPKLPTCFSPRKKACQRNQETMPCLTWAISPTAISTTTWDGQVRQHEKRVSIRCHTERVFSVICTSTWENLYQCHLLSGVYMNV